MSTVLLADFGASRVKVALWCLETQRVLAAAECPSPEGRCDSQGRFEIQPEKYWLALEEATAKLLADRANYEIKHLCFCTEMHGFLLDNGAGVPVTSYISWRDQRARRDHCVVGASSLVSLQQCHGEFFRTRTGMHLKMGLPWITAASMACHDEWPEGTPRLLTLADWLLVRGGCPSPRTHPTLAAGTGFFDLTSGKWSHELARFAGLGPDEIQFTELADNSYLGDLQLNGHLLSVWGGLGDFQAALTGAGFPNKYQTVINLGTGSQVATVGGGDINANFEVRPGALGGIFRAITHIPSGRALSAVADLMDGCAVTGGGRPFFWETWATLTGDEVISSPLTADLNMFDAAWKYRGERSGWLQLREGNLQPRAVIASVAKAWVMQYVEAFAQLGLSKTCHDQKICIAGGLSRRSFFLSDVLLKEFGLEVSSAPCGEGEETFVGLAAYLSIGREWGQVPPEKLIAQ